MYAREVECEDGKILEVVMKEDITKPKDVEFTGNMETNLNQ